MRLATVGAVGAVARSSGGGVSAPSTPTLTSVADDTGGQSAYVEFTCPSLNGGALTAIELRWSTSAGMTSPTTLTASDSSGANTWRLLSNGSAVAIASMTAGTSYYRSTGTMTGTKPSDGVAAYYQLRLTNSAGASAWSTAYGPVTTSFIPG